MIEPEDWLDKMLDDALASYGKARASERLEQKVLARVAESERGTRSPWPFLLVTAAALGVLAAGLSWWNTRTPGMQTSPQATTPVLVSKSSDSPRLPSVLVPARALVLTNAVNARQIRKKLTAPKLPQFPASSPLTSEEQALIHLVRGDAKYIPTELTNFGGPVQPIQITALEVKPLQLEWRTQETTCCDR